MAELVPENDLPEPVGASPPQAVPAGDLPDLGETEPLPPGPASRPLEFVRQPGQSADLEAGYQTLRGTSADEAAKVMRVADESGLAPSVVALDPDGIGTVSQPPPDFDAIRKEAPGLAMWASHPQNMAQAHDDLGALSWLEKNVTGSFGTKPGYTFGDLSLVTYEQPEWLKALNAGRARLELSFDETRKRFGLPETISPFAMRTPRSFKELVYGPEEQALKAEVKKRVEESEAEAAWLQTQEYQAGGIVHRAVYGVFANAHMLGGNVVAGLIGGPAGMFGFNFLMLYGDNYKAFEDIARQAGKEPSEGRVRAATLIATIPEAAVYSIGLGRLIGKSPVAGEIQRDLVSRIITSPSVVGAVSRFLGRWGIHATEAAVTMNVAAAFGTNVEEALKHQNDPSYVTNGQEIVDKHLKLLEQGLVDFALISAFTPGRQALNEIGLALRSGREAAYIRGAGEALGETKLAERNPAAAEDLLARVVPPETTILVAREAWEARFGDKARAEAADLARDNGASYDAAATAGGMIAFPFSRYLAKYGTTDHYSALAPDSKLTPESRTPREQLEFEQGQQKHREEELKRRTDFDKEKAEVARVIEESLAKAAPMLGPETVRAAGAIVSEAAGAVALTTGQGVREAAGKGMALARMRFLPTEVASHAEAVHEALVEGLPPVLKAQIRRARQGSEVDRIQLERRAIADKLTGLYSREVYEAAKEHGALGEWVVAIDANDFKLQDVMGGHPVGDTFLTHIGESMRKANEAVGNRGSLGRSGGDEFHAWGFKTQEEARRFAEELAKQITTEISPGWIAGVSMGLGVSPAQADLMLYQAKARKAAELGAYTKGMPEAEARRIAAAGRSYIEQPAIAGEGGPPVTESLRGEEPFLPVRWSRGEVGKNLREWTSRREAAAKRAVEAEAEKAAGDMFLEPKFKSVEERKQAVDKAEADRLVAQRAGRAERWRRARSELAKLNPVLRRQIIESWNKSGTPADPEYLLDRIHQATKPPEPPPEIPLGTVAAHDLVLDTSTAAKPLAETRVVTPQRPGSGEAARYRVVDASYLVPSHDPETFRPSKTYPENVQERPYDREPAERDKVIRGGDALNPELLLTNTPTPVDGPPLVARGAGIVLGGNGRTMMLLRAFKLHPEKVAEYRAKLEERARSFGINPRDFVGVEKPVLVREMLDVPADAPMSELQSAVRRYNEGLTQELSPRMRAVAEGKMLSLDALEKISDILGQSDATLREIMADVPGPLLQALKDAGIITDQNWASWRTVNRFTEEGKDRLEGMLQGRVVGSVQRMNESSSSLLAKLERIAVSIVRVDGINPSLSETATVQKAIDLVNEARIRRMTVGEVAAQLGLFSTEKLDPAAVKIGEFLERGKPREIEARFKLWAKVAAYDPTQGFLLGPPPDRATARRVLLGEITKLEQPAITTLSQLRKPSDSPDVIRAKIERLREKIVKAEKKMDSLSEPYFGLPKKAKGELVDDLAWREARDERAYLYEKLIEARQELARVDIGEPPLLVQHNLTARNLKEADELGGLAMPSLAIARGDEALLDFGEITLLGGPDLATPARDVPVFAGDAWTPRFPQVRWRMKSAAYHGWLEKMREHLRAVGATEYQADEVRKDGPEATLRRESIRSALARRFLEERGKAPEIVMEPVPLQYEVVAEPGFHKWLVEHPPPMDPSPEYLGEMAVALAGAYERYYRKVYGPDAPAAEVNEAVTAAMVDSIDSRGNVHLGRYDALRRDIGKLEKERPNALENQRRALAAVEGKRISKEFEAWAREQLGSMFGERYIVKYRDIWDRGPQEYGIPYTLENVVREMARDRLRGGEGGHKGMGQIAAAAIKRFRSLEGVKQDRKKLKGTEIVEREREANQERFNILVERLRPYFTGGGDIGEATGGFRILDNLSDALIEAFKPGHWISRELELSLFKDVPTEIIDEVRDFMGRVRDTPVEYFEAKPKKAIPLSAFKVAVIPDNASPETVAILKKAGLEIRRYPTGERITEEDVSNHGTLEQAEIQLRLDTIQGAARRRSLLFQAPLWYSPAEQAIAGAKRQKGTGDAWWAEVQRGNGVKAEELEVLGLRDWLSQQKGVLTKDQVLDYIKVAKPELPEEILGEPPPAGPEIQAAKRAALEELSNLGVLVVEDQTGMSMVYGQPPGSGEPARNYDRSELTALAEYTSQSPETRLWARSARHLMDTWDALSHGDETVLPLVDGKPVLQWDVAQTVINVLDSYRPTDVPRAKAKVVVDEKLWEAADWEYRARAKRERDNAKHEQEILVDERSPSGRREVAADRIERAKRYERDWMAMVAALEELRGKELSMFTTPNKDDRATQYGQYVVGEEDPEGYREILLYRPKYAGAGTDVYTSPHWSDYAKNLMAHARVYPLETADRTRVLFLDEAQSDLHQAGREVGYRTEAHKREAIDLAELAHPFIAPGTLESMWSYARTGAGRSLGTRERLAIFRDWLTPRIPNPELVDRIARAAQAGVFETGTIPDTPYKETWEDLIIKRTLHYAAKSGYQALALAPSEVPIRRWGTELVAWRKATPEELAQKGQLVQELAPGVTWEEARNVLIEAHRGFRSIVEEEAASRGGEVSQSMMAEVEQANQTADVLAATRTVEEFTVALAREAGIVNPEAAKPNLLPGIIFDYWKRSGFGKGLLVSKGPSSGWMVTVKEQHRGEVPGIGDLEQAAIARGLIKPGESRLVVDQEEFNAAVERAMRSHTRSSDIAKTAWERMQTQEAGTYMPRAEGMVAAYDKRMRSALERAGRRFGLKVQLEAMPDLEKERPGPLLRVSTVEAATAIRERMKESIRRLEAQIEESRSKGDRVQEGDQRRWLSHRKEWLERFDAGLEQYAGTAEGWGEVEFYDAFTQGYHKVTSMTQAMREEARNLEINIDDLLSTQPLKSPVLRITDEARLRILNDGLPMFQPGARGPRGIARMTLDTMGRPIEFPIQFFQGADASTVAHEIGGHFLSWAFHDVALSDNAGPYRSDYQRLLKWAGYDSPEQRLAENSERAALDALTGDVATLEQRRGPPKDRGVLTPGQAARLTELRGKEEKIAHGFELYFAEGKAPSPELERVFAFMREAIVKSYGSMHAIQDQYRALYGSDLQLTDDVRQVFDRWLAAEQAVDLVRRQADEAKPMGELLKELSPLDRDELQAARLERKAAEEAAVYRTALAQEKKVQDPNVREAARAVVEGQVDAEPVYRLLDYLARSRLPEEGIVDAALGNLNPELLDPHGRPWKLDRGDLVEQYGEEFVKTLPRGSTIEEGGVSSDWLAERFGFASGDDLVKSLQAAMPREAAIAARTQQRLNELYPQIVSDPEAAVRAAVDAEHSVAAVKEALVASRILVRQVDPSLGERVRVMEDPEYAKGKATELIEAMPVGTVSADRFLREERRYSKEALELTAKAMAKDTARRKEYAAQAIDAREKQLLNIQLWRLARDIQKQAGAIAQHLRPFAEDDALRARIGKATSTVEGENGIITVTQPYLDRLDDLLAGIDWRKSKNGSKRAAAFSDWLEEQPADVRQDALSVISDKLLRDLDRTRHWTQLTITELRDLKKAVDFVAARAKLKVKLRVAGEEREFEGQVARIVQDIKTRFPGGAITRIPAAEPLGTRLARYARKGKATVGRPEELYRELGPELTGAVWDVVSDSELEARRLIREQGEPIIKAMDDLGTKERAFLRKTFVIDGHRLTGESIFTMGLNWGNLSNRGKLIRGELTLGRRYKDITPMSQATIEKALLELSPGHVKVIQAVWTRVGEAHWEDIANLEKEVTGTAPEKVEAHPFTWRFKDGSTMEVTGGYYPVAYDPRFSKAGERAGEAIEAGLQALAFADNYERGVTPQGHLQARLERFARPVDLSLGALPRAIVNHMRDLAMRKALMQAREFLTDARVRDAIQDAMGEDTYRALVEHWKQTANEYAGPRFQSDYLLRWEGRRRTAATGAVFAANVALATQNFANVLPALDAVPAGRVAEAVKRFSIERLELADWVYAKSRTMQERHMGWQSSVARATLGLSGRTSRAQLHAEEIRRVGMWMMETTDMATAIPVWVAAYEHALAPKGEGFRGTELAGSRATGLGMTEEQAVRHADQVVRLTQSSYRWMDKSGFERHPVFRHLTAFYGYMNSQLSRFLAAHADARLMNHQGFRDEAMRRVAKTYALLLASGVLADLLVGKGPNDYDGDGQIDWIDVAKWTGMRAILYPPSTLPLGGSFVQAITGSTGRDVSLTPVVRFGQSAAKAGQEAVAAFSDEAEGDEALKAGLSALEAFGWYYGLPVAQVRRTGDYWLDIQPDGTMVPLQMSQEAARAGPLEQLYGTLYGPASRGRLSQTWSGVQQK